MKKYFSFLFFILFIVNLAAFGQQDPQLTHNMFYKLGVNAGYAGSQDGISGIILNRYQWSGYNGAPKTLIFSADATVQLFGSPGGVGLNIISDEIGFEKNVLANAVYAYHAPLSFGTLGIGVSLGFLTKSFNIQDPLDSRLTDDYNSGILTPISSDPGIPQGEASQMAFDAGLGVYLKGLNYYLGASVTHLNEAPLRFADQARSYLVRNYYFMGGYNIQLPDPLFELRPAFLLKSDAASWQLDLNTNVVYDNRFWGGLSYRIEDALSLLLGLELVNGLQVGYSFDLTTSALGRYGYGSHEIFVSYLVNLEKNRSRKYKSVRFL